MADTRAAVSILIGAKLGSTFKNSFTTADKQLSKLGATIKSVEGKAAQIEAYKQQSRALNQVGHGYICRAHWETASSHGLPQKTGNIL